MDAASRVEIFSPWKDVPKTFIVCCNAPKRVWMSCVSKFSTMPSLMAAKASQSEKSSIADMQSPRTAIKSDPPVLFACIFLSKSNKRSHSAWAAALVKPDGKEHASRERRLRPSSAKRADSLRYMRRSRSQSAAVSLTVMQRKVRALSFQCRLFQPHRSRRDRRCLHVLTSVTTLCTHLPPCPYQTLLP